MSTLFITRGLPGSGKTTLARRMQVTSPDLWRVNRDDLRAMLRPQWTWGDGRAEDMVTAAQNAIIGQLLATGLDVVVDDTNLYDEHVDALTQVAQYRYADVQIIDLRDVPLEECLRRDRVRPHPVGDSVINAMYRKHIAPEEVQE